MNFAFNEEQEELRAMARAFLADHSSSERVRAAMASEHGYDPGVWKRIGSELGWPALLVPEPYGGLGLSWIELVALLEITGEALLCSPFFSTVCLGASALLVAGSEAQKQEHLPVLAAGQLRATLAFSEAGGRWDADGIETVARRDAAGFVLEGTKRYVPDGAAADLLIVAARADGSAGEEGVSLFLVGADAPGLRVTPLPTVDQTRRQAQVVLDGVRVPAEASLGEPGTAWPASTRPSTGAKAIAGARLPMSADGSLEGSPVLSAKANTTTSAAKMSTGASTQPRPRLRGGEGRSSVTGCMEALSFRRSGA